MGPVKAALEASLPLSCVRARLQGHSCARGSPGPLKTRAASGLKDFDLLLNEAAQRAPVGELIDIIDVGFAFAFLATPYARRLSGAERYTSTAA